MKKTCLFLLVLGLLAGLCACGGEPAPTTTAPAATAPATTAAAVADTHALTPYDEQYRHLRGKEYPSPNGGDPYMAIDTQGYHIAYVEIDGMVSLGFSDSNIRPDPMPEVFFMPETIDGYPVDEYAMRKLSFERLRLPDECETSISMDLGGAEVLEIGPKQPGVELGRASASAFLVDENNPYVCDVDGVLMSKDKTILLEYPGGSTRTSYTIPASVQEISATAFDCTDGTDLRRLVIPASVTRFPQEEFPGGAGRFNYDITIYVEPGSAAEQYFLHDYDHGDLRVKLLENPE